MHLVKNIFRGNGRTCKKGSSLVNFFHFRFFYKEGSKGTYRSRYDSDIIPTFKVSDVN